MWGVCPGPHMGPRWLPELVVGCPFPLHGHTQQACPPGLWIPGCGAGVQPESPGASHSKEQLTQGDSAPSYQPTATAIMS